MRPRWLIGFLFSIGTLLGTAGGARAARPFERDGSSGAHPILSRPNWPRRPGVIIYRLKPGVLPADHAALLQQLHAVAAEFHHRSHHALRIQADARAEEAVAAALMATGAVDFAEPDYLAQPALSPNDPRYAAQWSLPVVNAPRAWDVTTGAPSVILAICDSGIDASHPDLAGRVLPGYNSVDGSGNTAPIASHGTWVAGIAAAAGNNGVGMAGISWSTKILPVRITNNADTSAYCSDMASGIEWAADHGAKVINLSYDTTVCPNTIESAAAYAYNSGALTVAAVGNGNQDLTSTYPVAHTFLLVGAVDASKNRASFSNYGAPLDLMAPGTNILTTSPGAQYYVADGTSFAAPMVSGVAALLYSINGGFSVSQIKGFLLTTATDLGTPGKDETFGSGLLNAALAVDMAKSQFVGNRAPIVSAGNSQTIVWPSSATLSGSVTDDGLPNPPGRLSVVWSEVSGPGNVTFSLIGNKTIALFSLAGAYVLKLSADDGLLAGSDQITVTVKPGAHGEGGLPAPGLNVPPQLALNSQIAATYPPNLPISGFRWSFRPATASRTATALAAAPGGATLAASWATPGAVASLKGQPLAPGYYQVNVQAYSDGGIISPAAQAFVALVQSGLDNFRLFPNPWRSDLHSGHPLTFDHLSMDTTIKIFTLAGQLVRTLTGNGSVEWDLKNSAGDQVASGLYLYLATDNSGSKAHGKLVVIH